MAEYCPKCNYKLKITDWRPECPKCGVNVMYYGIEDRLREEADKAEENFKSAFQQQVAPEDTPEIVLDSNSGNISNSLVEAILSTGKYASKGEIKRLFAQSAVKINGEKVTDLNSIMTIENETILQIGKGNFYRIIIK